jgi:uncharacterized DUF497 family protein
MKGTCFEWDNEKDLQNQAKHNISFRVAQQTFLDSNSWPHGQDYVQTLYILKENKSI